VRAQPRHTAAVPAAGSVPAGAAVMDRCGYALSHPITDPDPATVDMDPYRAIDVQPDGNLLMTILAVDR
jgi:hypothetical protein